MADPKNVTILWKKQKNYEQNKCLKEIFRVQLQENVNLKHDTILKNFFGHVQEKNNFFKKHLMSLRYCKILKKQKKS
jgi:hypothetical protein